MTSSGKVALIGWLWPLLAVNFPHWLRNRNMPAQLQYCYDHSSSDGNPRHYSTDNDSYIEMGRAAITVTATGKGRLTEGTSWHSTFAPDLIL